jgi:hypothetical protein
MTHTEGRRAVWAYTALNASVALLWLAAALGRSSGLRPEETGLFLLVGIPLGGSVIWVLRRKQPAPLSRAARTYVIASKVGLTLAWIPVGLYAAFVTMLWVALAEPWPLSLRQGPDTRHAREVFAARFGFPAPPSVRRLYARHEWAGFGEHVTSVTFEWTDEQVIRDIVSTLSLETVPQDGVTALHGWPGPPWWPTRGELSLADEAYRRPGKPDAQVFMHLWIDRKRRRAYFQDVDVG